MAKSTPKRPAPRASGKAGAKALQLLGRWTRISQSHLPFGSGCSCGAPMFSIRVADLEREVLEYLSSRHALAREAASIADLLRSIAAKPGGLDSLLVDLERSLASFEETHR